MLFIYDDLIHFVREVIEEKHIPGCHPSYTEIKTFFDYLCQHYGQTYDINNYAIAVLFFNTLLDPHKKNVDDDIGYWSRMKRLVSAALHQFDILPYKDFKIMKLTMEKTLFKVKTQEVVTKEFPASVIYSKTFEDIQSLAYVLGNRYKKYPVHLPNKMEKDIGFDDPDLLYVPQILIGMQILNWCSSLSSLSHDDDLGSKAIHVKTSTLIEYTYPKLTRKSFNPMKQRAT